MCNSKPRSKASYHLIVWQAQDPEKAPGSVVAIWWDLYSNLPVPVLCSRRLKAYEKIVLCIVIVLC